MPLRLTAPLIKDFFLEESDKLYGIPPEEATMVTIKQATQIDDERRSELLAKVERVFDSDPNEFRIRSQWTMEQLKRLEVYRTLVGCNILNENGTPLFRFKEDNGSPAIDMSQTEFEAAWGKLYTKVAEEIHLKVLEVNIPWQHPLMG